MQIFAQKHFDIYISSLRFWYLLKTWPDFISFSRKSEIYSFQVFKFSKFYVSEHQKILFVTIFILVVCKLLFFRFIRNRTAPALRKKCGKTCESPVKCILVNFSVCFNWVELLLVFLVLKYKIQIMIQKTNRFIDNLTSNIWNMVNFKNLLNF